MVRKSADPRKDQTYAFYGQTQEQLARTLTPCGDYTKEEIRRMALEWAWAWRLKPDSQEICFIPDNDYRRFLREYRPEAHKPGPIVDKTGKRMGTHDGIAFYTVGQRKGLRISSSERLYVIAIDEENNALVVGTEDDVFGTTLAVRDVNWVSVPAIDRPVPRPGEIRYNAEPA